MTRLPNPGSDTGQWGEILNEYLSHVHTSDGSLKPGTVGADQLQDGAVTDGKIAGGIAQSKVTGLATDLAAKYTRPTNGIPAGDLTVAMQTSLAKADTSIQSVNTKLPSSGNVTLTASDVGAASQSDITTAVAADKAQSTATVVYSGSAYPARPSGYASVKYIGPVAPTSAVDGDEWVSTA